MNTEKKQKSHKQQQLNNSSPKEELVFIDKEKEPCETCDKKPEVQIQLPNWTFDELQNIQPLLDKYGITRDEQKYIYNLYNRIFKTNQQPGCGKCLINVIKNLKNKYRTELNNL